jgi:hypothetical protein
MIRNGWLNACALLCVGLLTLLLTGAVAGAEPDAASPAMAVTDTPVAPAAAVPGAGAAQAPKPPAQFTSSAGFSGGLATDTVALTGVRFGEVDGAKRMVLDFGEARLHPHYTVEYRQYPYRLIARFSGLRLADSPQVQSKGALPFSLVTAPDGTVKELQVFLGGPSEFKVIEVDDPAKLAIDVRRHAQEVPTVYAVQLTAPQNAAEAFALAEGGQFPAGYAPEVLVVGQLVVVEQAFTEASAAAEMDAALRKMGYASAINERGGNELPSR